MYINVVKEKEKTKWTYFKWNFSKAMFILKYACVIVLNVKKKTININVKFDEMSSITHEKMRFDPMLWLVINDLCH